MGERDRTSLSAADDESNGRRAGFQQAYESSGGMMKIGLIDVDGHNFPNLPLMKLSAWHKARGDTVEWYQPMFSGHMDRVYMSKVFSYGGISGSD